MTVKELKEFIEGLPDDMPIIMVDSNLMGYRDARFESINVYKAVEGWGRFWSIKQAFRNDVKALIVR